MNNDLEKAFRQYISDEWSRKDVDAVTELVYATASAMEVEHLSKGAVSTIMTRVLRNKGFYDYDRLVADLERKYGDAIVYR